MARPDLYLPPRFLAWLAPYLAAFSRRSRPTVAALAVGALLAVGPRTVTNCLRALGLAEHPGFTAFHRVLNRNTWSGLALARRPNASIHTCTTDESPRVPSPIPAAPTRLRV